MNHYHVCASLGCPRRGIDSSRIANYLQENGWKSTSNMASADLIVVYTCGGFKQNEDSSMQTIRKALSKKKADCKVIVTGCLLKINQELLNDLEDVRILNSENLSYLDGIIKAKIQYETVKSPNKIDRVYGLAGISWYSALHQDQKLSKAHLGHIARHCWKGISSKNWQVPFDKNYYNIEISRGCLNNCTYCAIKFASEPLKSKPEDDIIQEFTAGIALGYKKFVLLAADTGCYGQEIGTSLPSLLEKIFSIEGDYKIVLNDINARWFVKYYQELKKIFIMHSNRLEDIRIPIQSGSNKILNAMDRGYSIDEVKTCLADLYNSVPNIKIETHIIVGFPGESVEDFQATMDFVKKYNFCRVSIYSYEDRPKTKASNMKNKVTRKIIKERALKIRR